MQCGLPLCGPKCQEARRWHLPECEVFSQLERRVAVQNYGRGTIAYEYGCISVLRLLWLRWGHC